MLTKALNGRKECLRLVKKEAITMYIPTRQDWELLPMSEEAEAAMTDFFVCVLESDNPNDIEEAKRRFKEVRRNDMKNWLRRQRRKEDGRH